MKRKEPDTPSGGWQFEVGHGHWKDFGKEDMALLDSLSTEDPVGKTTTKAFSFGKGTVYDIDFGAGTQTNKATGKVRKIRHSTPSSGTDSRSRPTPPVSTFVRGVKPPTASVGTASPSAPSRSAAAAEATATGAAALPMRELPAFFEPAAEAAKAVSESPRPSIALSSALHEVDADPPATRAPPAKKVDTCDDTSAPPMPPPEEPPPAAAATAAPAADAPAERAEPAEAGAAADSSRTLKRKEPEDVSGEWQFEVGHGHWKAFGDEDAALLQSLKSLGKASTKALSFGKGSMYELDFDAGKQINTSTGKIRKIRCVTAAGSTLPPVAVPVVATATVTSVGDGEKPAADTPASTISSGTSASMKRATSSDDVDFAGAMSAAPTSIDPPAKEEEHAASATETPAETTAVAPAAKGSETSTGKPDAKKKSAWSADSKIPDGPPLSTEDIKKQAHLGAQSKRGWKSISFGPIIGKNKHATHCFEKMLENEKRNCGEWAVFYHSYSHAALIYEVQAAIAAVLFRFKSTYAPLPRLMRGCFSEIPDAPSMMKEFPTWPEQDHSPRFKCVGICATTSLLGTDPEAPPTMVFLGGYAASSIPITVVEGLLTDCGIDIPKAKKLTRQIMDLAGKYGLDVSAFGGKHSKSGLTGHLLQIFMKRHLVDKYAYASFPMGVPDASRHPIGDHLQTCGLHPPGHIVGQVRIVVHPSAFLQASKVRMFVYSADEEFHQSRSDFQELVTALLSPVLGSEEARTRAAKAIFGGALPSWFHADDQRETAKTASKKLDEGHWK